MRILRPQSHTSERQGNEAGKVRKKVMKGIHFVREVLFLRESYE